LAWAWQLAVGEVPGKTEGGPHLAGGATRGGAGLTLGRICSGPRARALSEGAAREAAAGGMGLPGELADASAPDESAGAEEVGKREGEVVCAGGADSEIKEGERVLVVDAAGRKYIVRLKAGRQLQLYKGLVSHEIIAAAGFGGSVKTHKGAKLRIHRLDLEEYVLGMKRAATPIYPKDACTILMMLNLSKDSTVLEAGSGSGGLTLYLAGALAGTGTIWSFDTRLAATNQAAKNVADWLGEPPPAALASLDQFSPGSSVSPSAESARAEASAERGGGDGEGKGETVSKAEGEGVGQPRDLLGLLDKSNVRLVPHGHTHARVRYIRPV
jgi:hypothetical protein